MTSLDGPDLFQLQQERPQRPMHTLKVAVLDGRVDTEVVDAWAAETLTSIAPLRWVLAGPGWARPALVDGGSPDLARHVDHVTLPPPGGERELTGALAALCARPLDRSRPLWRLTHLTGLAGGGDVLAFQVHHAIADGVASVTLWESMADHATTSPTTTATTGSGREAGTALRSGASDLARLPSRISRLLASSRRQTDEVAKAFAGPATRFNGPAEAERACAFATLSLSDLRSVRDTTGATLTQVFLTVAGGAVRRHLEACAEPLDASLTATVPTALPGRRHSYGNAVTTLYVDLHSDIVPLRTRLDAVGRSLAATREATAVDPRVLPDLQRFPRLYGGLVSSMDLAAKRKGRPAYNLIVSSVRGPEPFSLLGAPVRALRSLGPLSGHLGLNLTGWSYGDAFTVGIHAYASAGAGLDGLGALLGDELDRLQHDVNA